MKPIFSLARQSVCEASHFQNLLTEAKVFMGQHVCLSTHLWSWGTPHWPGSWIRHEHPGTRHYTPSHTQTWVKHRKNSHTPSWQVCRKQINTASSTDQWSKVVSLGYNSGQGHRWVIYLFFRTRLWEELSDWPCVRFTAALQQRQQDRIVLVAAVMLCFIVQVGQQFNTLRRATRHRADTPSDRLNTAMMDDILQFADKRALTAGKVAWPTPKGPSTQHSSDRYLRLKESRDQMIFASRSSLSGHDCLDDRVRFKRGTRTLDTNKRKGFDLTGVGGQLYERGSWWSTGWVWVKCWEHTLCSNADTSWDLL